MKGLLNRLVAMQNIACRTVFANTSVITVGYSLLPGIYLFKQYYNFVSENAIAKWYLLSQGYRSLLRLVYTDGVCGVGWTLVG